MFAAREDRELHGASEEVTGRLKHALGQEHGARQRLQEEIVILKVGAVKFIILPLHIPWV